MRAPFILERSMNILTVDDHPSSAVRLALYSPLTLWLRLSLVGQCKAQEILIIIQWPKSAGTITCPAIVASKCITHLSFASMACKYGLRAR
jgi:hypothetical protein